jgi:DNA-binding NtrC family response regulator
MPHIVTLSVGRDPLLLQTRSQVLRSDGYTVSSTLSAEQALQQFKAGDFDIVILCHSIPARERERLADAIHGHSPNTPVVVVAAGFSGKDRAVDAVIENEPATLLQELPRLLRKAPENYQIQRKEA